MFSDEFKLSMLFCFVLSLVCSVYCIFDDDNMV